MAKFIFAYHGSSAPETPEDQERVMAAWGAWFGKIGPALADPGNPVGLSKTVSASGVAEGGGPNPLSGYTVVNADDIDAACAMAKGCPIIDDGGSVEVAEIHEISM